MDRAYPNIQREEVIALLTSVKEIIEQASKALINLLEEILRTYEEVADAFKNYYSKSYFNKRADIKVNIKIKLKRYVNFIKRKIFRCRNNC